MSVADYGKAFLAWGAFYAALPVWVNGGAPPASDALSQCWYYRPVARVVTPATAFGILAVYHLTRGCRRALF